MTDLTGRELSFAILAEVAREKRHRGNLLGRPYQAGQLEAVLRRQFSDDERDLAYKAFDALLDRGLVRQPRHDVGAPGDWVTISDAGRKALERRALDDLDEALLSVSAPLVQKREAMWAAFYAHNVGRNMHSTHSARELITQTLHALTAELQPVRGKDRVERKDRIREASKLLGKTSAKDRKLIENLATFVDLIYAKLSGEAHSRAADDDRDLKDLLDATELALRRLLL